MALVQNKKILITGATSGIGLACAEHMASLAPATYARELILTGRRQDRLEAIKARLEKLPGVKVHTAAFDIRDRSAVEGFAQKFSSLLTDVDVLINNAGLAAGLDEFQNANMDDWDAMVDTNIKGLLYITRQILPLMIARGSGHIVNIGSVAGRTTYPKGSVYTATKHAVRAINDSLRIDTVGSGVRVSSVDPGMVESEFSVVRFKGDQARADAVYKGVNPLTPADIAETVAWCLNRPAHVNIQEVLIMPTDQASPRDVNRRS